MALFRRNRTDDAPQMPPEVQNYYSAEKRERTWFAWLLALGTLVVTILVILGLFYGGRWAFRKLRHQKTNTPVAVQKDTSKSPGATPESKPSTPSTAGSTTASGSSTATAPSSTPATSSSSNSSSAAAPLPNTGPGNVIAIFVVTSLVATLAHHQISRRFGE